MIVPRRAGLSLASTDGTAGSTNFIGDLYRQRAACPRITVGFWQDFYKGDLGRMRYGLQYERVQLDLFNGVVTAAAPGGGLHPNNQIVFFSLRHYPFN